MTALPAHRRDLTGKTFERWTVLGFCHVGPRNQTYWHVRCSCGKERTLAYCSLISGNSRSCGCLRSELAAERNRTRRIA